VQLQQASTAPQKQPGLAEALAAPPGLQDQHSAASSKAGQPAGGAVKVTLHDCLACSGCITTAETLLLEQQSTGELLAALKPQAGKRVVVTVSPQSRAALAGQRDGC
jgi:iron only hydrogenase large subunit-like protein